MNNVKGEDSEMIIQMAVDVQGKNFWGAEGAPILFSDLGLRMASCSYI